MYAGCVPKLFWFVEPDKVKHNRDAFIRVILPFQRNLKRAFNDGYGLLLLGDNGTGKTLFMSYLLGRAVNQGFTIYYTTLARLDAHIKRGFGDQEATKRLTEMLGADFLVIDEMGKEHIKRDGFLMTQLEMVLKERYDDGYPTMMASNLDFDQLSKTYGTTIASMLEGRYEILKLEGGDYRKKASRDMRDRMGYK
jgi:DNA replication protein DnaC